METSHFLFAGYTALWIIPTTFLFILTRRLIAVDARLKKLAAKAEAGEELKF